MRIVSVNTGTAESIGSGRNQTVSGINKQPAAGSVFIGSNGLKSDVICNEVHHGGVDQAVYAYSASDYAWWSAQLGREIAPGTFGENLTIEGLPGDLNAGDLLRIGDVILEATAPRIPCATLAARMQDRNFGLQFRRAMRPGVYFRVISEGDVAVGDTVVPERDANGAVSMLELFRLSYEIAPPADVLKRMLDAPIAVRMREKIARKLAAAN